MSLMNVFKLSICFWTCLIVMLKKLNCSAIMIPPEYYEYHSHGCYFPGKSMYVTLKLSQPFNKYWKLPTWTVALYSCDKGYELIGQQARVCLKDGSWSDLEPWCGFNVAPYAEVGYESDYVAEAKMAFDGNMATCAVLSAPWEKIYWPLRFKQDINVGLVRATFELLESEAGDMFRPGFSFEVAYSGFMIFNDVSYREAEYEGKRYAVFEGFHKFPDTRLKSITMTIQADDYDPSPKFELYELAILAINVPSTELCHRPGQDNAILGIWGDKCLSLFTLDEPLLWKDASWHCHNSGGELATISDVDSLAYLEGVLEGTYDEYSKVELWVGKAADDYSGDPSYCRVLTISKKKSYYTLDACGAPHGWICEHNFYSCGTPDQNALSLMSYGRTEQREQPGYFAVGSAVHYSCPQGYRMEGAKQRTCLSNGVWSESKPPYCKR